MIITQLIWTLMSSACKKADKLNSLAPGGFENVFQNVFFKLISWIDTLSNSCETALRSMPQNPSDDKSTLVQVMAWCRQAASHYLSQCCPRSLSPYGVTRPQWVNLSLSLSHYSDGNLLVTCSVITGITLMGWCKIDVTPLLTHWSYVFLALTHQYIYYMSMANVGYKPNCELTKGHSSSPIRVRYGQSCMGILEKKKDCV